jgi:hypothetical protein
MFSFQWNLIDSVVFEFVFVVLGFVPVVIGFGLDVHVQNL